VGRSLGRGRFVDISCLLALMPSVHDSEAFAHAEGACISRRGRTTIGVVVIVFVIGLFLLAVGCVVYLRPEGVKRWIRKRGLEEESFLSLDSSGISTRARGVILILVEPRSSESPYRSSRHD
jgi:hypothetical protein